MTAEQLQEVLTRVSALTGETDTTLLTQLANAACDYVLSYTNRTYLPATLVGTVSTLTIISYNRLGTEGESGRSEAGESYSFETAPESVFSVLNKYRLARVGGNVYELEAE